MNKGLLKIDNALRSAIQPTGYIWKSSLLILLFVTLGEFTPTTLRADNRLQVGPTATPVSIQLPSPLPFVTPEVPTTATATRTPTPPGPALLEALTEANVRAQPDPESERLGIIRAGDLYPVIGRYFRWIQLQYDQSSTGFAWVFDELVRIIGDEASIKDLAELVATTSPAGELNTTAQAELRLPMEGATVPSPEQILATTQPQPLPTFTFPASVARLSPKSGEAALNTEQPGSRVQGILLSQQAAPITPIVILIGLGILGLLISSLRK